MKKSNLSLLVTANLLASISVSVSYAETSDSQDEDQHLEEVLVTGNRPDGETTTSLKTPELLINVPQSVSVITAEQIADQGFTGLDDVIHYTPGVTIGQGEGHRDQITIRGQNTTADFFQDGLRDDIQYFRPLYNIERVEVLRGSNALVFGRGGGGGVINRVSKVPIYDEAFNEISANVDSFGATGIALDSRP